VAVVPTTRPTRPRASHWFLLSSWWWIDNVLNACILLGWLCLLYSLLDCWIKLRPRRCIMVSQRRRVRNVEHWKGIACRNRAVQPLYFQFRNDTYLVLCKIRHSSLCDMTWTMVRKVEASILQPNRRIHASTTSIHHTSLPSTTERGSSLVLVIFVCI